MLIAVFSRCEYVAKDRYTRYNLACTAGYGDPMHVYHTHDNSMTKVTRTNPPPPSPAPQTRYRGPDEVQLRGVRGRVD